MSPSRWPVSTIHPIHRPPCFDRDATPSRREAADGQSTNVCQSPPNPTDGTLFGQAVGDPKKTASDIQWRNGCIDSALKQECSAPTCGKIRPHLKMKKNIQRPVTSFMWSPFRTEKPAIIPARWHLPSQRTVSGLIQGWSRGPAQAKHIGPQVASMGAGRPRISRDRSTTNKINMWVSELQDTPIHCTVHRENHHDQPENFGSDLSTFHVHTSPCKGAQTHGVAVADLAALGKWRSVVVRSRSCCWSSCNSQCYSMYWLVEARWIPYICWWVRKKLDPKFLWTPILHGRLPPRNSTVCSWKLPLSSLIYPWKMVIFQFASS